MAESDDEPLTLSSHALAALAEFNAEKDLHRQRFEQLRSEAEADDDARNFQFSMDDFSEDWNKSQFWYSEETASTLAKALLEGSTNASAIAIVSAPSVFVALRNLLSNTAKQDRPTIALLEHDNRFAVFPEFVFYDYQQPLALPAGLKQCFDRIMCDPPFLSEDCQTKAALTVRWLSRGGPAPQILVCTGERMEALITSKLYRSMGVRATTFAPRHARGLSNEFYCYANFERGGVWTFQDATANNNDTGEADEESCKSTTPTP